MTFVCRHCSEAWEHHPVSLVTCPTCKACPGQSCKRPSGHNAAEFHIDRERAALDAGVLKPCKLAPAGHYQPDLFAQTQTAESDCNTERLTRPFDDAIPHLPQSKQGVRR